MQTFRKAFLTAQFGGQPRQFPIPPDRPFRIGRDEKCDAVLTDTDVSRKHAMLQRTEDDRYYLSDLGSINGTHLNSTRISKPTIVKTGDRISIGDYHFLFFQETEGAPLLESTHGDVTRARFQDVLISVVVADIRDFTPLAARTEPKTLSIITRTLFNQVSKALQQKSASMQKYIGDAVMAVWRHDRMDPPCSDFIQIFEAVAEIATIAGSLQGNLELNEPVRLGASVNTGIASLGNVGSIANSDYTAMGDVVVRAFRLESATRPLGCDLAVGQNTFDFLKTFVDPRTYFRTSTVCLKGFKDEEQAHTIQFAELAGLISGLRGIRTAVRF
jgi:adenylate cyclase